MPTESEKKFKAFKKQIRKAIADYMYSEGCSCCRDSEAHEKHKESMAKLLNIKKKDDYYDFSKYNSKNKPNS